MFKRLLLATVLTAAMAGVASAAPIVGSFSFTGFSGTFVGGTGIAATATGLDFGTAFSATGSGNGYGTAGTALVANADGSFSGLGGAVTATVADIAISGNTANPYTLGQPSNNTFITFTGSNIQLSFSNAAVTRSSTGTSVTVAGNALYTDGIAADTTTGMFSLSANSQLGMPASVQFTFTGNASAAANAVPEPLSISLLGAGLAGLGLVRARRKA